MDPVRSMPFTPGDRLDMIEAVFMDFRNLDALRVESELARTLGHVGKVAIHPAQVPVISDVFTPSPEVVEPRLARLTMEVYIAADLSAETGQVIDLPLDLGNVESELTAAVT